MENTLESTLERFSEKTERMTNRTQMPLGNDPMLDRAQWEEVSRENVELYPGCICDMVTYDIPLYGPTVVVENITVDNGQFRRMRSMIPFTYLDKRAADFNWSLYGETIDDQKKIANSFLLNYWKYKQAGKGLYIFSNTKGSGKTMLACCLANELMYRLDVVVKFISIPELLEMTKKGYKNMADQKEVENIKRAELLVIDDIGTEMQKEWVDSVLFQLIDWRYTNKLVTIFTSNIEIQHLKLDDRIIDRIYSMCIVLKIPEKSIRMQQADRENVEFIQEVTKK